MLHTWQAGDVSDQEPYNGSFDAAMKGIKAKILVLPCKTDLYFPPEDSEIEVAAMRPGVGELAVFPSIWGEFQHSDTTDKASSLLTCDLTRSLGWWTWAVGRRRDLVAG